MRHQISRLAVGLFLVLFASQSIAAGSDKYQQYRKYLQTTEYDEVAMAMDADGRWAFYPADMVVKAKWEALHVCRQHSKRPETCKIVDVSGLSAWWRGGAKGNPASSTYVASSSTASALVPKIPAQSVAIHGHEEACHAIFTDHWMVNVPTQNATDTQEWDMKCWDYISKDGNRWIGSNKSGSSSTASSSSSSSSVSSSSGSAGMVWCATHSGVKKVAISLCSSRNGFFSKSQAEHAYRRLKSDSGNTVSSLKKKLLELKSLVDEGLITEEEYAKAKKRILDNM